MSAFLMFVILAVATDTRAVGEAAAIAIGGTIALDAMFGGPISGASMNPMRSLGPALVSGDLHALWLYIVAPIVGTSLGGLAYQFVRGTRSAVASGSSASTTTRCRAPGLLDVLGAPDERLTHLWFPRRWLWNDGWLTSDPWAPDWQLRLVRQSVARFPGRTHIPVEVEGLHAYVDAPLYHLDLVVNDDAHRAAKARHYEQARPGLRLGGLPLNAAYYLPELRDSVDLAPVPAEDLQLVRSVRETGEPRIGAPVELRLATREEIDAHWAEAPLADEDYRARIELCSPPSPVAGEIREVDVRVTNLGSAVWPGGVYGLPEIRLSYRWRGVEHLDEQLRTALPHDVRPGESVRVPLAFRAPDEPGTFELIVDLVHERHRWFGAEASVEVAVGPRRQAVVLVGQPPGETRRSTTASRSCSRESTPRWRRSSSARRRTGCETASAPKRWPSRRSMPTESSSSPRARAASG